jgi:Domain of unknown function (DUF4926)
MIQPQPFDTIELLVDLPDEQLRAGALGAIVEDYGDNSYEVEFVNEAGETLALCPLSGVHFIVIWQQATGQRVPMTELMLQLADRLGEAEQRQVLDFAHFLHARRQQASAIPA